MLHLIVIHNEFPLPHITETLQAVHNCKCYTSFDLAQGYLQMPVKEGDVPETAFRAGSSGLYKVSQMPFGLSNSGSSFCCMIEMCLGDQLFLTLLLYFGHVCIFAASIDKMLDRIDLVFERLNAFNLKFKPQKSHFFQCSVVFLGHMLSPEGISSNPEKVEKVQNWPVPTSTKEIHSFLGLVVYYQRFIPKFTTLKKCFHKLIGPTNDNKLKPSKGKLLLETQKDQFEWQEEHQKLLANSKDRLTNAPVLAYHDFTKPFELEMDASLSGLGTAWSLWVHCSIIAYIAGIKVGHNWKVMQLSIRILIHGVKRQQSIGTC